MKYNCVECGEPIVYEEQSYIGDYAERMLERRVCFTCLFWLEKVDDLATGDPRIVIVDDCHYYANDFFQKDYPFQPVMLGFGGAVWNIAWDDGRRLTTNNLWCQGGIPDHFKERLPNNACFISEQDMTGEFAREL